MGITKTAPIVGNWLTDTRKTHTNAGLTEPGKWTHVALALERCFSTTFQPKEAVGQEGALDLQRSIRDSWNRHWVWPPIFHLMQFQYTIGPLPKKKTKTKRKVIYMRVSKSFNSYNLQKSSISSLKDHWEIRQEKKKKNLARCTIDPLASKRILKSSWNIWKLPTITDYHGKSLTVKELQ